MNTVQKSYTPQSDAELISELADLRKGSGLTPVKLQYKPALRALVARLTNLPPVSITTSQVHAFLVTELAKVDSTRNGLALKNALGLGQENFDSLLARRAALGTELKKHPDTIERYENQGVIEFATHLMNLQTAQNTPVMSGSNGYLQHLEEQASKARAATSLGLSGILSLENRTDELINFLESSPRPFLDTYIDIVFSSSERGKNWYRMAVTYTFQGRREAFRLAVVTTNEDGESLMKQGLVDEFHKLNDTIDPTREMRGVINTDRLTLRNPATGRQKLLRFQEVGPKQTELILQSIGHPLLGSCRLLEIKIPPDWQTSETIHEYYSAINLRDDVHYAYWYAPSLMYVKRLSFDYSAFPEGERWQFMALPFLGHIAGDVLNRNQRSFVLHPNSWIMPGHGIGLTWE